MKTPDATPEDDVGLLVRALRASGASTCLILGPSGAGKTTLAEAVAGRMRTNRPDERPLCVSLDDFILSGRERRTRGLAYRAQPGSHDVAALRGFLRDVRADQGDITLPRFDKSRDEPGPVERVRLPVSLLLFEGWFQYEEFLPEFDLVIYLDLPLELARERRLDREARLRDATGGGFSRQAMIHFWDEVLEPGVERWVAPLKTRADLVLTYDAAGALVRHESRAQLAE